MPIRKTLPRRSGTWKVIEKLYANPVERFFAHSDDGVKEVCDLIYGPTGLYIDPFFNADVRRRGRERLVALKTRWAELRDDILAVQAQYAPDSPPWGARFDKKSARHEGRK